MAGIYNDYFMQLLEREGLKIDSTKMEEAIQQLARLPKENMKKFIVIYVGEKLEVLEEVG